MRLLDEHELSGDAVASDAPGAGPPVAVEIGCSRSRITGVSSPGSTATVRFSDSQFNCHPAALDTFQSHQGTPRCVWQAHVSARGLPIFSSKRVPGIPDLGHHTGRRSISEDAPQEPLGPLSVSRSPSQIDSSAGEKSAGADGFGCCAFYSAFRCRGCSRCIADPS